MQGEIVTIGDELISGRTGDTNAGYVAGRLTASGFQVTRITSVGDDPETVSEILSKALNRSAFVILTGGLGPTTDDKTNKIVSGVLNRSLRLNRDMLERMKIYAEAMGVPMTPTVEKMAWLPEGARLLNPKGFTCGCHLEEKGVQLYFLPGVPDQAHYLMDNFVLPELIQLLPHEPAVGLRQLRLFGIDEPGISEKLTAVSEKIGEVNLGFYPHFPENHITLSLLGSDQATVDGELDRVENEINRLLSPFIYSREDRDMEEVVGAALLEKGLTVSVAESCSGGLICDRLTNVAGSSAYFQGGLVAYSNQAKMTLLQVSPDTLTSYGAVSNPTVQEMAKGVKDCFQTDLGLAVTGIAGPSGGTKEKPVGTVHIGLAAGDEVLSGSYVFWGKREEVKLQTAMMALDWIRRYLNGSPFLPGV